MSTPREFDDNNRDNASPVGDVDDLLATTSPVDPRPGLRDEVLAAIDDVPQEQPVRDELAAFRRRPSPIILSAAAAVVLVAAVGGLWGAGVFSGGTDGDASNQSTVAEDSGVQEMHAIMDASDLRNAQMEASGVSLDVVASTYMDKGGAMVDGQPALDPGMGAQVWATDDTGEMHSAGMIGQDPHDQVWMPLPGNTMKVSMTMEPDDGSDSPTGPMLADAELAVASDAE